MKKKDRLFVTAMTTPAILILLVLSIFPLAYTIKTSFTDYYLIGHNPIHFVGLDNYRSILKDAYFITAVKNTVKFTVFGVILETGLGMAMAVFVHSLKRGKEIVRTLVLLPMLLPPVTVALIWQTMLSNHDGVINEMLGCFNIATVNWLMDVKTAFLSVLMIDIWQYSALTFLLLYASLQGVSESQYEAASIDGAGGIKKFIYITLPNIKEGVMMVILLRVIDTFRLFDKVNILTKGGPANSTATITQYIYQYGTKNFQIGYASAASVVMTVIILVLSSLYLWKNVHTNQVKESI